MTRSEAEGIVGEFLEAKMMSRQKFVAMLEGLGVLKLEEPEGADFREAGKVLEGRVVHVSDGAARLTLDGAHYVLDVLRARGFKVVRK